MELVLSLYLIWYWSGGIILTAMLWRVSKSRVISVTDIIYHLLNFWSRHYYCNCYGVTAVLSVDLI